MANNITQKSSPIFILFTIGLTAVFITLLIVVGNKGNSGTGDGQNVSIVDGKQVIEILARGGYSPRKTVAKAGVPTILRVKTENTYDCSSSLVIPALNYRKFLSASDTAEVEIPPQKAGDAIKGVCGMGMYSFNIEFTN